MAPNPALSLLDSVFNRLADTLPAPPWLVEEGHRRIVLLLNHVLMQEPEAQHRLRTHVGRSVQVQWRQYSMRVAVSPAGLFDLSSDEAQADLDVRVMGDAPSELVSAVLTRRAPPVQISGDVQFAAALSWLGENLRWDLEEDLSRVLGDVAAHQIVGLAKAVWAGLRGFVRGGPGTDSPGTGRGAAQP